MFDPLTHFGQRASSLVSFFRDQLHYPQTIILTPRTEVTGFPLQNFYRYVLSTSSQPNGEKVALARFTNLPSQHTLTARMDVPEPLNVQTSWASQVRS